MGTIIGGLRVFLNRYKMGFEKYFVFGGAIWRL
jgi:hypothetical protein